MSNTEKGRRRKAEGSRQSARVRRAMRSALKSRRFAHCLLLSAFCLLSAGCRMDMQDQPRYEYYEAGDKKFFPDGASSRPNVEGTVPRQPGGPREYRDRQDYF